VVCKGYDAEPIAGDDAYVSPSGSDGATGTSPDQALATLAHALCNAAPGQTIHVGLGTYLESVLLSEFGDPRRPIHIVGEVGSGGERPVLDGEGKRTYGLAFIGEDADHPMGGFSVENLEIRNYTDAALLAVTGSAITLKNLYIHHDGAEPTNPENDGEGYGIDVVEVTGGLIEGCEGAFNGPSDARVAKGFLGNDITIWGSTDITVRDNHTHDGNGGGFLFEDTKESVVENNLFETAELDAGGQYWDGALWVDGGADLLVKGNTVARNHGPAIQISDEDLNHPTGYVFEDNLIQDNKEGVYIWNFGVCPWPDTSVVDFRASNVFSGNTDGDHRCEEWACGEGKPCG
jgi:hypothetical protein